MPESSAPPGNSVTASHGACVSCKSKKLKCDRLSQSCSNCQRHGEECMVVDPGSGQLYARRYVDDLRDKAERLRHAIAEKNLAREGTVTEASPGAATESQPLSIASAPYGGSGSIFSLGQLVAAAVSRGSDNSVLRLADVPSRESPNIERVRVIDMVLPSLGDAVNLVKSYFNALHVTMPFMRQQDVFRQLERLYTNNPPYTGHERTQDLFQLHMVFAIGAMGSDVRWGGDYAKDHYVTAMGNEYLLSGVDAFAQVQNLLLVFVFATLHAVGIASTWEIIRQAMRICVKYGLHSQEQTEPDQLREQLRRRIFWSVYISDRHCSQNLGRPVALSEEDITVDLPINQDDENIGTIAGSNLGGYTEVTNLLRHTLLRRLGTSARRHLNRLAKQDAPMHDQIEAVNSWIDKLEAWYNSSIVKSSPSNAYESKEYLDINFHRERMKLLSYLILPSVNNEVTGTTDHLWQYTVSAHRILLSYKEQSDHNFLAPNWTHVQDVLKCGFGILYCAVQIPEQRQRHNDESGLSHDELDTTISALKLCSVALNWITARWQTVKRHANAFMHMCESVLELVGHGRALGDLSGMMAEEAGGVIDYSFSDMDFSLDNLQDGGMAFTDADWAELFDLGQEGFEVPL